METILNKKEKPVLQDMVEFLKELTIEEQKMFSMLIQGYQIAANTLQKKESA